MPIKVYKPTSAGRRDMTGYTFEEITKKKPERSLTEALRKTGGRNNHGRVTVRHRGGGNKRRYRVIDFKRDKEDCRAEVIAIEYDPNRSARIALLQYEDGTKSYVIAPMGVTVGDVIGNGEQSTLRPGNCRMLKDIPVGTVVHNIELRPGKGGQLARSAGTSAQILATEGKYVTLRLPSGEMRLAMLNIPMSNSVKLDVPAGWVGDRLFVVQRWIRRVTRMVVVKVGVVLVWRLPRHPGVRKPSVYGLVLTNVPINSLSVVAANVVSR